MAHVIKYSLTSDYLYLLDIIEDTVADGPGFRTAIYSSGCPNKCKGCQVPHSWDLMSGVKTPVDEILDLVLKSDSNVSFLGGEPFYQAGAFYNIAYNIKKNSSKTIWCWTGHLIEDLMSDEKSRELLKYIDILVDGPFVMELNKPGLVFRGSSNQRIIDVNETFKKNKVIISDYENNLIV